jgi:shikimate dehydrogenase
MNNTEPMDFYCVLGNPIEHSRSPAIHARFAQLTGQRLVYERRLFALEDFAGQLALLQAQHDGQHSPFQLLGCNVTVPFKQAAAQLAHQPTSRVVLAQACNTLSWKGRQWAADNTDGLGLVRDITHNAGLDLAGRTVLMLGAGGAAAGVLAPLLETQPQRVVLANRSPEKAQALQAAHQPIARQYGVDFQATALADVKGRFDVVVNATASSLQGQAMDLSGVSLSVGGMAYDMMYGPKAQAFLTWATEHGATARDGLGMLVEQAAEAFQIWRGVRPPAAQVLSEMRRALP